MQKRDTVRRHKRTPLSPVLAPPSSLASGASPWGVLTLPDSNEGARSHLWGATHDGVASVYRDDTVLTAEHPPFHSFAFSTWTLELWEDGALLDPLSLFPRASMRKPILNGVSCIPSFMFDPTLGQRSLRWFEFSYARCQASHTIGAFGAVHAAG